MAIKASTTISLVRVNDGADGKGIESTVAEYYLSTSNTTQSGGSWSTTPTAWVNGRYYWTRTKVTYTDTTTSTTKPICVTGGKGSTGATGNGVSEITLLYYLSDSDTILSEGSWTETIPEWEIGKWIWSKTEVTYTDNTTSETVAVVDQALNLAGNANETVQTLKSYTEATVEVIEDALSTKVNTSEYIDDRTDLIDRITGKADQDDISAIQQIQAEMLQTQEQWAIMVTQIQDLTGQLDTTVQEVVNYMTFGVEGLTLGKTTDSLKVQISNSKISFLDGSSEVAHISGQTLHISSATIINSLQIGNHKVEKWGADNKYTIFRYVGG